MSGVELQRPQSCASGHSDRRLHSRAVTQY
jgi:hypothetical protein